MEIGFGDNVAIIGIGPVGLMAVAVAVIRGAARVFALGSRQVCFGVAGQFGARDMVDYRKGDYATRVMELNGGEVDAVLVAGGPSQGITNGLRMVANGGVVANVAGLLDEAETTIPHNVWGRGFFDKTLRTVQTSGGRLVLEKSCNLVKYGRLHPERLVTHRFYNMAEILMRCSC